MRAWTVVVAVGLGSYLLRALPLVVGRRWFRSMRVAGTMAPAGTAALAALVATGLRGASSGPAQTVTVLAAAVIALAVAVRGASLLRVLAFGGTTYLVVLTVTAVRL